MTVLIFMVVWGLSGLGIGIVLSAEYNMDVRLQMTVAGFVIGFLIGIIFIFLYRKVE